MTWTDAPQFYNEVDEAALKLRFIELCARYPDENILAIGADVFKGSCDLLEANRIAAMWSTNLEVREAIRQYKISGAHPVKVELPTKETIALELLALARNSEVSDKERVNAYKAHAEVMGYISKNVNKTVEDKTKRRLPTIIFKEIDASVPEH